MLGFRFAPRFRDLDDQRFWRATMPGVETGTYGVLEDLARNRVNLNKVITHWPDMLRVAGSLVTNQVRAYDLLRMFSREGRPTPLGQAFAEYGRIAKTEHLLRVVDPVDDTYRRQMNRQLTVQESRHKLARDVCHGKRGTIHQAYRDGMEDQLGALGLVLNAIVLWTTRYIDAAVAALRAEGHEIRDEDIARLSPLKHRNPEPARPLQLPSLHPGRRHAAAPAGPGHARPGRGRRRQRGVSNIRAVPVRPVDGAALRSPSRPGQVRGRSGARRRRLMAPAVKDQGQHDGVEDLLDHRDRQGLLRAGQLGADQGEGQSAQPRSERGRIDLAPAGRAVPDLFQPLGLRYQFAQLLGGLLVLGGEGGEADGEDGDQLGPPDRLLLQVGQQVPAQRAGVGHGELVGLRPAPQGRDHQGTAVAPTAGEHRAAGAGPRSDRVQGQVLVADLQQLLPGGGQQGVLQVGAAPAGGPGHRTPPA